MNTPPTSPSPRGFAAEIIGGAQCPPLQVLGRITIGDVTEHFRMSTAHWQPQDYRNSWALALRELLAAEVVDSCLVTSITEPAMSNFISCWPLYRRGEKVHVQEALIFLDVLEVPFDEHRPWLSVRPRRTVSEDGLAISEWVTSVGDVREFARTLGTAEGGEVDDGLREDLRG